MNRELGEQIWDAVGHLPARQQQVFHLRIVEMLSFDEIAEALDLSNQAVRSNLAAARKNLRRHLGDLAPANSPPRASDTRRS